MYFKSWGVLNKVKQNKCLCFFSNNCATNTIKQSLAGYKKLYIAVSTYLWQTFFLNTFPNSKNRPE